MFLKTPWFKKVLTHLANGIARVAYPAQAIFFLLGNLNGSVKCPLVHAEGQATQNGLSPNVSFLLQCDYCHDVGDVKSLTVGLFATAAAPRDSGQTARIHKLTGHRSADTLGLVQTNKNTRRLKRKTSPHRSRRGAPTWQRTFPSRWFLHVPLTSSTGMPPRPLCLSPTS